MMKSSSRLAFATREFQQSPWNNRVSGGPLGDNTPTQTDSVQQVLVIFPDPIPPVNVFTFIWCQAKFMELLIAPPGKTPQVLPGFSSHQCIPIMCLLNGAGKGTEVKMALQQPHSPAISHRYPQAWSKFLLQSQLGCRPTIRSVCLVQNHCEITVTECHVTRSHLFLWFSPCQAFHE